MIEVSIITPSYNSERYISSTIESVINQTFENWEMIIVDDCSKDNTLNIVKKYSEKDPRIRYSSLKKNSGSAAAPRNKALSLAKGRFVAFLDSDDIWHPKKLELQVNFMKKNDYPVSYTSYKINNIKSNKIRVIKVAQKPIAGTDYLKNTIIGFSTSMIDRKYCPKIKMPNFVKEDALFWPTLLIDGIKAYGLDSVLMNYRVHDKGISNNKVKMASQMWQLYRNELNMSFYKSLYYFTVASVNKFKKDFIS